MCLQKEIKLRKHILFFSCFTINIKNYRIKCKIILKKKNRIFYPFYYHVYITKKEKIEQKNNGFITFSLLSLLLNKGIIYFDN